jgi:hypothetical protein
MNKRKHEIQGAINCISCNHMFLNSFLYQVNALYRGLTLKGRIYL